jgi:hypothetical protein
MREDLAEMFRDFVMDKNMNRQMLMESARHFDWQNFFSHYKDAYSGILPGLNDKR